VGRAVTGKLSVMVADFKPVLKNTLRGFATIRISEMRLEVRDVAIHQKGDSRWAQLPARPQLDRNGAPIRDSVTGKIAYSTLFEFFDQPTRDAFGRAVVAALLERFPHAFAEEDAA
jgi:hypothetical protein